jgi:DNA-binding transcriptional LysR family regulator
MDALAPLALGNCDHITLTKDSFVPVSKSGPDGPLHHFDSPPKKPVSLLSYGTVSALRSVVEHALRQNADGPKMLVVNQSALANSVKAMVLEGFGLGWLPQELCKEELAEGRMQIVGHPQHRHPLEIRLYRDKENSKPTLNRLWRDMQALSAGPTDTTGTPGAAS